MPWVCYLLECADGTLYTGRPARPRGRVEVYTEPPARQAPVERTAEGSPLRPQARGRDQAAAAHGEAGPRRPWVTETIAPRTALV